MSRPRADERDGSNWVFLTCPVCEWTGDVVYKTHPPTYCSDACKQRAYRQRKRQAESVTDDETASVTDLPKATIEKQIDQTLHLLNCDCKRGIWTVKGNVQIGGLRCDLCGGEFKKKGDR